MRWRSSSDRQRDERVSSATRPGASPPAWARHRYPVVRPMPICRHASTAGTPSRISFQYSSSNTRRRLRPRRVISTPHEIAGVLQQAFEPTRRHGVSFQTTPTPLPSAETRISSTCTITSFIAAQQYSADRAALSGYPCPFWIYLRFSHSFCSASAVFSLLLFRIRSTLTFTSPCSDRAGTRSG